MRRHPARYRAAGISPARLMELRAICMQYREYKRELHDPERARLIEDCAEAVAGKVIGKAVVKSVSEGAKYARLSPPCGERQFYQARMAFFIELHRRLLE